MQAPQEARIMRFILGRLPTQLLGKRQKENPIRQSKTRCVDMDLGQISVLPHRDEIHTALKRNF